MIFCNFILELFLTIQLLFEKPVQSSVVSEEVIPDLYSKYKEAVLNEMLNTSSRRLFTRNKQYEIHVEKLKEVNGFKKHNLMIKENLRIGDNDNNNTYIYINNPVESKIPKSFLTLEEFKEVLINRVKSQRPEMATKQALKIFNETKLTAGQGVNKSKTISKILGKMIKMEKDTTIENFKYKIDGKIDKHKQIQITKTVATNKTKINTVKLDKINIKKNELTNVNLGNNTKEVKSLIPYKTTEIETINTNLEPIEAQQVSSNPSTIQSIYETKIDIDAAKVTTTLVYDRTSINSELSNENQPPVKNSDEQSTDTFTTKYDTKYEDESTTSLNYFDKNVNNHTSPEINSNDYITMTTEELITNVYTTENPTLTETEFSTIQVRRKTAKLKRKTSQKVSFQVPKKRSTLGRPLVFMGRQ